MRSELRVMSQTGQVDVAVMVMMMVMVITVRTSPPPAEPSLERLEEEELQCEGLDILILYSGINGGGVVCYWYGLILRTGGLLGTVTLLVRL